MSKRYLYYSLIVIIISTISGIIVGNITKSTEFMALISKDNFFSVFCKIIVNNTIVCSCIILSSCFIYLVPTIIIFLNFFIFGSSVSIAINNQGFSAIFLYMHGIVEIPVIVIVFAISIFISTQLLLAVRGRNIHIKESLMAIIPYLKITIILLIASAVIESLLINFMF